MEYLILGIILFVVVVTTAAIWYSVHMTGKKYTAAKIMQYGKASETFIYDLLVSVFPQKRVFRNLYIPIRKPDGIHYTEIDIVCVTHGGIVVVEVKGARGHIKNPEKGQWVQFHRTKQLPMENPYIQNEKHIMALNRAMNRAKFYDLPIENIVVFSDNTASFQYSYPWLMHADEMMRYMAEADKDRVMTKHDIRAVCSQLAKYKKNRHRNIMRDIKKKQENNRTPAAR